MKIQGRLFGYLKNEFEIMTNKPIIKYDNAINVLQEYCAKEKYDFPKYQTTRDFINFDNSHNFTVCCSLNGIQTDGNGSKVKDAKKQAAYNMLKKIGLV